MKRKRKTTTKEGKDIQKIIKKGMRYMLGIPDVSVWLAYVLCIGGMLLCVVYGVVRWNKDDDADGGKNK